MASRRCHHQTLSDIVFTFFAILALALQLPGVSALVAEESISELKPFASVGSSVEDDPFEVFGVSDLLPLPRGELAVASFGSGVFKVPVEPLLEMASMARAGPSEQRFKISVLREDSALRGATSLAVLEDGGVVVGGGEGLHFLNGTDWKSATVVHLGLAAVNGLLAHPSHNIGLVVAADSGLYLATTEQLQRAGSVSCLENSTSKAGCVVFQQIHSLGGRFAYDLTMLPDGGVVVATDAGAYLFSTLDPAESGTTRVLAPGVHITSVSATSDGGLIAGTLDGAICFSPEAVRKGGAAAAHLARRSAVWDALELPDGSLLLATSSWTAASEDRGALLYRRQQWHWSFGQQKAPQKDPQPIAALAPGAIIWSLVLIPGPHSRGALTPATALVALGGNRGGQFFEVPLLSDDARHSGELRTRVPSRTPRTSEA